MASLMLASSTAAAMPQDGSLHAGTHRLIDAGQGGRSMQTLVTGARIFDAPDNRAGVRARLGGVGTGVSVACWTAGVTLGDNPIWYRVSAPAPGYVAAFNIAAHFAPAPGVRHCVTSVFRERFNSLEVNLRIRTSPSVSASIAGYLVSVGSQVTVDCFVDGSSVYQDDVWYHAVAPVAGYVTGRFLNTGGDPVPGIPRC